MPRPNAVRPRCHGTGGCVFYMHAPGVQDRVLMREPSLVRVRAYFVFWHTHLQRSCRLLSSQVFGFEGMIEYLVLPGIPSEDELVVVQSVCTATASTLYTRACHTHARHTRAHT